MRKQELIHLHALCVEVRSHVEAREDAPSDAFEVYDQLDVDPASVYRRKEYHKAAVETLLAELVACVEGETSTRSTPNRVPDSAP